MAKNTIKDNCRALGYSEGFVKYNFNVHFKKPNCPYMGLPCVRFAFGLKCVDCFSCSWEPSWAKGGNHIASLKGDSLHV